MYTLSEPLVSADLEFRKYSDRIQENIKLQNTVTELYKRDTHSILFELSLSGKHAVTAFHLECVPINLICNLNPRKNSLLINSRLVG